MEVDFVNESGRPFKFSADLRIVARRASRRLKLLPRTAVQVALVTGARMRRINWRARGQAVSTDVLAFPLHGGRGGLAEAWRDPDGVLRLGDVVISRDAARKQAERRRAPEREEVSRLFAHGLLHLLGQRHDSARAARRMESLSRQLLRPEKTAA